MPTLIRFPARRVKTFAAWLLNSSACRTRLSKPTPWIARPIPSDPLGNMLQRLALLHPDAVLLLENIVADVLEQIEHDEDGV